MRKIFQWMAVGCLLACLATNRLAAHESVAACNGKVYKKGDVIIFGAPKVSGYLYVNTFADNGNVSVAVKEELTGKKATIIDIPAYEKKLFESMGVYSEPETRPLVVVEMDGRRLCIDINNALSQGHIVTDYFESKYEGAVALTSDIAYVYALKLNKVAIDDGVVTRYMAHCNPALLEQGKSDPFAMADLKKEYTVKLNKALGEVDFSRVFRIEACSNIKEYDVEKGYFPLEGLWCPAIKTDQPGPLEKIGFCKWNDCVFRFVNTPAFAKVSCDAAVAKGFYGMRKFAKTPAYNKPLATSYAYVRFIEKPVQLPQKKELVYHEGGMQRLSLDDMYGKAAIEAEIVRMDVYTLPFLKIHDFEVMYNYLGTIAAR